MYISSKNSKLCFLVIGVSFFAIAQGALAAINPFKMVDAAPIQLMLKSARNSSFRACGHGFLAVGCTVTINRAGQETAIITNTSNRAVSNITADVSINPPNQTSVEVAATTTSGTCFGATIGAGGSCTIIFTNNTAGAQTEGVITVLGKDATNSQQSTAPLYIKIVLLSTS